MNKSSYPWHDEYWHQLTAYVKQQRIPQALLINSVEGLGQEQLAMNFAQYVMCTHRQGEQACGQCTSCHLLSVKTHPDFILIKPEEQGKAIGVDIIRQLIKKLVLKPQYSGYRVVIISSAEAMNNNSANAFLKCLEEPPERTLFFLLAEQIQQLPATIRSRCQKMSLTPPAEAIALTWLQGQQQNAHYALLLHLANGAPLKALRYAQDNTEEQRKLYFEEWENIILRGLCPITVAEKWYKLPSQDLLAWLISWVEDIIKCTFYQESQFLVNTDLENSLQGLVKHLDVKKLFEFYDLLLKDTVRIQTQLNKQLLFEEMLIIWAQTTVKK